MDAIQSKSEIFSPEEIDSVTGVQFLGTELFREGRRWWVTQKNYLQDLLNRKLGPTPWTKRKVPMLAEMDSRQDPPNHNLETTREAQQVVGELVWVATRSRPDLSHKAGLADLSRSTVTAGFGTGRLVLSCWHFGSRTPFPKRS